MREMKNINIIHLHTVYCSTRQQRRDDGDDGDDDDNDDVSE
jgi:hypothetical protein